MARAALAHYLATRMQRTGEPLCVTLPGHRPPSAAVHEALSGGGFRVDPDEDCRFEVGRVLFNVDGVWRVEGPNFVALVSKSEFGDISLFLEGYEYTLRRERAAWRVVNEKASLCNPKKVDEGSVDVVATAGDAEQGAAPAEARKEDSP